MKTAAVSFTSGLLVAAAVLLAMGSLKRAVPAETKIPYKRLTIPVTFDYYGPAADQTATCDPNAVILPIPPGPGRFQIAASGIYPDFFVLDTQTGEAWRYLFDQYNYDIDKTELIQVEYLGSVKKPAYEVIAKLKGSSWKEFKNRPVPFAD